MQNKMARSPVGVSPEVEVELLAVKASEAIRALHADIRAKALRYAGRPMPQSERQELLKVQAMLGQVGRELKEVRGSIARKGHDTMENKLFTGKSGTSSARHSASAKRPLTMQQLQDIKESNELALFTADISRKLDSISRRRGN